MTTTILTSEAKESLRKAIRGLRTLLLDELGRAAKGEYQLEVGPEKARLSAGQRARRKRLEDWLDEQCRTNGAAEKIGKGGGGKASKKSDVRERFFRQAVEEASSTLLNRLVLVRILEHHGLIAPGAPLVVSGGWKSAGFASEFLGYAGPLSDDDARGYRHLLETVFAELALELPGLFGKVGLTTLFPVPASTLRAVIDVVNDPALESAWGDDTTLGWVYQYWNDPEREALDAKIAGGGKIEPHEIASKTQMFTERYMVEWLLQNSLGFTWLSICRKNGWTPDAEQVLPDLDARRAEWRKKREAGEVALDALMPIAPGLESDWKYWVPQPIPDDAVEKAPRSIRDVKLLDPACGSGHFLVIAFGLFARMYEEEARHRGEDGTEAWGPAEIARAIVADNLHGIDIDARAIQIAAAALWLRAKLYAHEHGRELRLSRMNLVAPRFRLAALPKDDPSRLALETELATLGVPRATTSALVEALKGVDHLGTLLRVDRAIGELLDEAEVEEGPLFVHGAKKQRARLDSHVASFLDAHASESDLGLRLEAEQLAAGVRFIELAREGCYDVVVGNPPYQGVSKTAGFDYVMRAYPRAKADLYATFIERGIELASESGACALVTMRGWLFVGQYHELRKSLLHEHDMRALADLGTGAFSSRSMDDVISTALAVVGRTCARGTTVAVKAAPLSDPRRDAGKPARRAAALLTQEESFAFNPNAFEVIEGEPVVYWWTQDFLARYSDAPKIGRSSPAKAGAVSGNHTRFIRTRWELPVASCLDVATEEIKFSSAGWVRYVKGARGMCWIDPCDEICNWRSWGLEIKLNAESLYGSYTRQIRNEHLYFKRGIAVSGIGASFSARKYRWRAIFDNMAASVFPTDVASVLCSMNRASARVVMQSLNPGIHFEIADVNRLAAFEVPGAHDIVQKLDEAFLDAERGRETSSEFQRPAPSPWRYAQAWAQAATDRPADAPLPSYSFEYDQPDAEAEVSFAIGVVLGRFGAKGEGILGVAPKTALDAGILFVGPNDAYPDSLKHSALAPLHAAWESFTPATGKKPSLRDWLRKDFFAYHKPLYENRPIYFPLSSEKKSFVAWISIHRWTDSTLSTLLVDHLNPVLRQLDAEIRDATTARASSDKKSAIAAGKAYDNAKRLRDELADFVAKVAQCAERGAPPTDADCPPREVDAPFSMDLDDGVMINSAALWPLLAPQWSDPKKWWKQLCKAEGKKDYDWAHLTKRYFPTRVDEKCKADPSLAVAHGCFWRYHPAKAFAWELRLQDEIRPDFTIDETDSNERRAAFLQAHAADAEALREKERVRRERKAKKEEDEPESAAGAGDPESEAEDDDG